MRRFLYVVMLMVICVNAMAQNTNKISREEGLLHEGEYAILGDMMVQLEPAARTLCIQSPYACVGVVRSELGLDLIASINSSRSKKSLVDLSRYRLDGDLGESFGCYVLANGQEILPYLKKVKSVALNKRCQEEVAKFKHEHKGKFDSLAPRLICAEPQEIETRITNLTDEITHGVKCSDGDS